MISIGETDYRNGARERIEDALLLLQNERFAACAYLAGRAVEGFLRAVLWKHDKEYSQGKKSLDTGHNLVEMLKLIDNLGLLAEHPRQDTVRENVWNVDRLWWNTMRFVAAMRIEKRWRQLREVGSRRT